MALQHFRDKQKLIYWIVAIVVIPSFVGLGFTGAFTPSAREASAGTYFGKKCSFADFYQHRNRLFGIYRHVPTFLGTIDQRGQFNPIYNENISAFLMMALAEDARRHGIDVTENEVGTFIRAQLQYNGNNPKEFTDRIQREINNRTLGVNSIAEYQQAVRENLLARKFLALIDNSIVIPRPLAEMLNAQEHTEYAYQRVFVPAAAQTAAATAEINKIPAAEMQTKAEEFIRAKQVPANRRNLDYLWSKPQWKIEYLTVPFSVPSREPKITEEKLKVFYDTNKSNYKNEKGEVQELAAVKEKVEADLRQKERRANAQTTIKREVDDFIRRRERNMSDQEGLALIALREFNSDPRLASLALKAGDSGAKALTIEEIFAMPELKDFAMSASYVFGSLDSQITAKVDAAESKAKADPKATPQSIAEAKQKAQEEILSLYRKTFHGQSFGANTPETPLSGENGLMRFRVVEYVPGMAKTLRDAKGQVDEKLLAAIKNTMIEQLALEKAEQAALKVQTALKENKKPEGVDVKDEKAKFRDMNTQALAQLRTVTPGTVLAPARQSYPEAGYEILKAVSVNLPAKMDAKEIDNIKRFVNLTSRNGQAYAPESFASPWILLGTRADSYIRGHVMNQQITVNPALMRNSED